MLGWTEPSTKLDQGIDHLGLRVAGEACYSQLIDFTTTVSWRPRYLSFYCWAAEQAFLRAGGQLDGQPHEVDVQVYRSTFKRLDFALSAATLVEDLEAKHIVGSTALRRRLSRTPFKDTGRLPLTADHVGAAMGGFAIYAGPMRLLGLLGSAHGFDVPRPGTPGQALAHAFGRSVAATGIDLLDADALDRGALARLGKVCGLDRFARRAASHPRVAEELQLVRAVLVDWDAFARGEGPSAARVLSLGILLELHRRAAGREVRLDDFRAATLLGIQPRLPAIYDGVLARWRVYQAHAYATLALESLLAFVLALAAQQATPLGSSRLVQEALAAIGAGAKHSELRLPVELRPWPSCRLGDAAADPWTDRDEPRIKASLRAGEGGAAWGYDASLLLVRSVVRLRQLARAGDPWTGRPDTWRLPPERLIATFVAAEQEGATVKQYLAKVLERDVLHQHHGNALRKLISRPHADSARFMFEEGRVVPLGNINPGTSSPRYANAVDYLAELGYLDEARPTAEGLALLRRINSGGGP